MEEKKNDETLLSAQDMESVVGGMSLDASLEAVKTNCRAYCARCHRIHDLADYDNVRIAGKTYRCYHCNDSHRQFAVSSHGQYFAWSTLHSGVVTKDPTVY